MARDDDNTIRDVAVVGFLLWLLFRGERGAGKRKQLPAPAECNVLLNSANEWILNGIRVAGPEAIIAGGCKGKRVRLRVSGAATQGVLTAGIATLKAAGLRVLKARAPGKTTTLD